MTAREKAKAKALDPRSEPVLDSIEDRGLQKACACFFRVVYNFNRNLCALYLFNVKRS